MKVTGLCVAGCIHGRVVVAGQGGISYVRIARSGLMRADVLVSPRSDPTRAPPEIRVELLVELMAVVAARLSRKEDAGTDPDECERTALVRRALREKRLAFDPHNAAEVEALIQEFSKYANALESSLPGREAS